MGYNYIPKYIRQSEAKRPKDVVTAARWNALFNLLIEQGDYTAEELGKILGYLSTELEDLSIALEDLTSNTTDHIDNDDIHVTAEDKIAWDDKLDKTGGTMRGDFDLNGNTLRLGATTKLVEYNVNAVQFSGRQGEKVELYGVETLPTFPDDAAASKGYVDSRVNEKLNKTGGTMTGSIRMGQLVSTRQKITMLGDPTEQYDAATKKYVDEHSGGGADNTFVVSGAYDGVDVFNISKTYAELRAAYNAGKVVEIHLATDEETRIVLPLSACPNTYGDITFGGVDDAHYSGNHDRTKVSVNSADEWSFEDIDYVKKNDLDDYQSTTITDTAGYYATDTVEGALAEIGGTLDGLEAAINTIRGIS